MTRPWPVLVLLLAPLVALLVIGGGYRQATRADLARWYARADVAAAAGRYDEALDGFAAAGGYRDADDRHAAIAALVAPADAAAREAIAALGAGDPEAAVAILQPIARALPDDEEIAALLTDALQQQAAALLREANAAEARRDWLVAERALAQLAADQPTDGVLASRLSALRRDHAPIVFARDHALYLAGPDGADERRLTDEVPVARPVWSPDRSHIAFVAGARTETITPASLYVIAADGSHLTRLSTTAHPNAVPDWSPDGTRLAYTSVAGWNPRREEGLLAVHVVDIATGSDQDVTSATGRHAMTPTWSPDSTRLAVVSRDPPASSARPVTGGPGDIVVFTLATGDTVNLTTERVPDVVKVTWGPMGDTLLFYARAWGMTTGASGTGTRLYALDAGTGELSLLAAGLDSATAGWAPAWHPAGDRVAYLDGVATVVVRELGGGETRIETDGFLSGALSWSPGGAALLAIAADARQPSVIMTFTDDGPVVTDFPLVYDTDWPTGTPSWSPLHLPAVAESSGG